MKKRIISLLLSALCLCTSLVGCKDKGPTNNAANPDPGTGIAREKYTYTDGVHDLTAPETDGYFVENGKCDYKILMPAKADQNLIVAESELKYFFEEATGVVLTTVTEPETGYAHDPNAKYISLGSTKMLENSGVDLKAKTLKSQGARVVSKDKTVYVAGTTSIGTLNAVYTFLNVLLDYEQFAYDCFTITETKNVKFRNFDVTDVPDIEMRTCPSTVTENNPNNLQYRLRTRNWNDYLMPIGDTESGASTHIIHNTSNVIPKEYEGARDTWFSDQSAQGPDNTQLCYTVHGNQEDYDALVERVAYVIERSLIRYTPEQYPLRNVVAFTHEDNANTMCKCKACMDSVAKYGTQSAAAIIMANAIRAKLEEWMNQPENAAYKRDNLVLIFFAYAAFVEAPAHYDEEQGKYVVNHPDLVMRDDVGVFYAVSSGFSYQQDIYDEDSAYGVENSLKWFDIAPSVYLWTYDANFGNFLFRTAGTNFYDSDAYQFFAQGNVTLMLKQSPMPSPNVTSFQMLDIYLDAKMQWDSTQDINELTQRWFKAMFRDAADVMFDLYVQENTWALIIAYETGHITETGIINYSISRDYWDYEMLKSWLEKTDKAMSLIAKYQTKNPDLYKVLKEHIDIEWVCPAYYMMAYNADSLSSETYNEMVRRFQTDISSLKDFRFSERSTATIGAWAAKLSLR